MSRYSTFYWLKTGRFNIMLRCRALHKVPRLIASKRSAASVSRTKTGGSSNNDSNFSRYAGMAFFSAVDYTYATDPRSAPANPSDSVARVKSGGYIYSLLEREDGTPVIVNRGWLPYKLLEKHMALDNKEDDGMVSLVGVLRHGEVRNSFTPDNNPGNHHFYYLDHEELAATMGVPSGDLPVIVDALASNDESGDATLANPVRKSTASYLSFYMTPEKHAGYAVTW
ncbi:hypothetical protein PsorP6_004372 [Peronosclerospora sorghi]|uniref:Uncharacterized protein n=1 Tax=Peronosclerospora sorghi TaxID=230839 RepID=A0ACC0VS93_9STRA|nr:hypothetical protein PsorP6_004372 [Peronosclerospora sorghi]